MLGVGDDGRPAVPGGDDAVMVSVPGEAWLSEQASHGGGSPLAAGRRGDASGAPVEGDGSDAVPREDPVDGMMATRWKSPSWVRRRREVVTGTSAPAAVL